jgi:hypothetical protein
MRRPRTTPIGYPTRWLARTAKRRTGLCSRQPARWSARRSDRFSDRKASLPIHEEGRLSIKGRKGEVDDTMLHEKKLHKGYKEAGV